MGSVNVIIQLSMPLSRLFLLEFPQFYPQTSDFSPFIINNFMKMPKI